MKCPECDKKISNIFKKLTVKTITCSSCKKEFVVNKKWIFFAFFISIMTSAQLHGISLNSKLWVLPLLVLLALSIILIAPLNKYEKDS